MSILTAPELTFPKRVANLVRDTYDGAKAILEYGSGGSTVLAAARGIPCVSVENDRAWSDWVLACLDDAHPGHKVRMHNVYIGPTRKWGRPSKKQAPFWRWRYPAYSKSVWKRRDLTMPDVILIDGRFRPACFVSALKNLTAPATILWDDYKPRPFYHEVEKLLAPRDMVGRMAIFDAVPGLVTAADMRAAKPFFTDMR